MALDFAAAGHVPLNCPHCRNPIEPAPPSDDEEVVCPSCGSSFRLDPDKTQTWSKHKLPKLDKFELIEAVGRGAFGTVYRARDMRLDRIVAIKVPRSGQLISQEDEDRFVREARNAAQLQHRGIVPVYEVGRGESFPYIVCEFVEGGTLADVLTARRLGFRESAALVAEVAEALEHAHAQGVVHRDLKPSNIMLTPDGTPRVMDFGLAKRDAGEVTVTVEGQVLGTPAYMSPEQASGQAHHVDGRSDVYSLGSVLYELVTGELPFRGNQRMLLQQVLHDEPRAPRSLNDRTPRDLETICLKAMAKEPARRYQTAQALADDLHRYLNGQPIAARPVGRLERGWRWCRRNPAVASLSAAVALALLAGTGVSTYFSIEAGHRADEALAEKIRADQQAAEALANAQAAKASAEAARTAEERADQQAQEALASATLASEAKDLATQEAARAKTEAERANRVAQFLAGMFESSAPLRRGGFRFTGVGAAARKDPNDPTNVAARLILDRGSRKAMDELNDQPAMQAALLDTIGNVYVGLGHTEQAVTLLEKSLDIRRRLHPEPHRETADSLYSIAVCQSMLYQSQAAAKAAREAVAMRTQLLGADHEDTIEAKFTLGFALALSGDQTGESESAMRDVLAWRRVHSGPDHPETAYAMIGLAATLANSGKTVQAVPLLTSATAALKKDPITRPISLSVSEIHRGRFLASLGQHQAAVAASTKAVNSFREMEGEDHPLFFYLASLHVQTLYAANRTAEAKEFARDQLRRLRALGRPLNPILACGIADALRFNGSLSEVNEAENLCREVFKRMGEEARPSTSVDFEVVLTLAQTMAQKATLTSEPQVLEEAEGLCRQCVAMTRQLELKPSSGLVILMADLAGPLERLDVKRGEAMYRDAVAITRESLVDERKTKQQGNLNVRPFFRAVTALGAMLRRQQQAAEAVVVLSDSIPVFREQKDDFYTMWLTSDLAGAYFDQKEYVEAERHFREAAELVTSLGGQERNLGGWPGSIHHDLARTLAAQDKFDEAEATYRKCVSLMSRHWPLISMRDWIGMKIRRQDADAAASVYSQSLAILKPLVADDASRDTGERPLVDVYRQTAALLGVELQNQGKLAEAETAYADALQLVRERHYDQYAFEMALALAYVKVLQRQPEETKRLLDEAIASAKVATTQLRAGQASGKLDVNWLGNPVLKYAGLLSRAGRGEEAAGLYRETIPLARQHQDPPWTMRLLSDFGDLLIEQGKREEAEKSYQEIIAMKDKGWIPSAQNKLFKLLHERGADQEVISQLRASIDAALEKNALNDWLDHWRSLYEFQKTYAVDPAAIDELLAEARRAVTLARERLGKNVDVAMLLVNFGNVLVDRKDYQEAEQMIRQGLEMRRQVLPPTDWRIGSAEAILADSLLGLKRYEDAEPLLLSGYANMKAGLPTDDNRLALTAKRLVRLYQATNKPEKVAEYHKLLPVDARWELVREAAARAGTLDKLDWKINFYGWHGDLAQSSLDGWEAVIASPVLDQLEAKTIDYDWNANAPTPRVPADFFAVVATTEVELPKGQFLLQTMTDDGVRVLVDGKLAIENWVRHSPSIDEGKVTLEAGRHAIRIEYYEMGAGATLKFCLRALTE